ncbi:TetR/AcrR family transcriptional regulator [Streptomyces sp. NPDC001852]|jgi:AcrR family transcriptional regulator|uniref:TetR/AcrR family transcriptional regulator n=1 Tax=Streptomyces sp. NPDC001852 TaxID=3364619 RepID=UPI00368E597E
MGNDSVIGLPTSIEVAWGLREPSQKGPKRILSLGRIVDTAVTVADADGIGAISMSRIAKELNSSTMSLYRYVSAKDELLPLMVDAAFGPPVPHPDPRPRWRAGLEHWSRSYLDVLRRHPWVVRIPISGPPSTPHQIAWAEQGLRFLQRSGLSEAQKMSSILLLAGLVRNEAQLADTYEAFARSGPDGAETMLDYRRLIEKLADADRFPAINAAMEAGVFDDSDGEDTEFSFALTCALDGIEALIRRRRRAARPAGQSR